MVPTDDHAADTTVISDYTEKGSTIVLYCWKVYDCFISEGFQHLKVNHSLSLLTLKVELTVTPSSDTEEI